MQSLRLAGLMVILTLTLLLFACNRQVTPQPSPAPSPTASPSPTYRIIVPRRSPTVTDTPLPSPTPVPVNSPGQPGERDNAIIDPVSKGIQPGPSIPGDAYAQNLFERPFTFATILYLPDLDLSRADLSLDDTWFYFSLRLAGLRSPTLQLLGNYGIELDLDFDGRGDSLLWITSPPPNIDWTVKGVRLYRDLNKDVGGQNPLVPDSGPPGDGYEVLVFEQGLGLDVDTAWVRLDPLYPFGIQLAVKRQALENPDRFLWSAWTDDDVREPARFDYNDYYKNTREAQPDDAIDLYSIDNTCRGIFGLIPNGGEPGICPVAFLTLPPTPEPSATLTLTPTITPTVTLTPTVTVTTTGTLNPTTINVLVWTDTNQNGVVDTGEPGLPGFTVRLGSGACPSAGLAQATSAADGRLSFTGLSGGSYCTILEHPGRTLTTSEQLNVTLSTGATSQVNFGVAP